MIPVLFDCEKRIRKTTFSSSRFPWIASLFSKKDLGLARLKNEWMNEILWNHRGSFWLLGLLLWGLCLFLPFICLHIAGVCIGTHISCMYVDVIIRRVRIWSAGLCILAFSWWEKVWIIFPSSFEMVSTISLSYNISICCIFLWKYFFFFFATLLLFSLECLGEKKRRVV